MSAARSTSGTGYQETMAGDHKATACGDQTFDVDRELAERIRAQLIVDGLHALVVVVANVTGVNVPVALLMLVGVLSSLLGHSHGRGSNCE